MKDYDPNMFLCGRKARQRIALTFKCWKHESTITIEFSGNVSGLDAINSALDDIYESLPSLPGYPDIPEITLYDAEGGSLLCQDDERDGIDWLGAMMIDAEILSAEPDGRLFWPQDNNNG